MFVLLFHTGTFRAPNHGLYYFRFTANSYDQTMGVKLFHNNKRILWNNLAMDIEDVFVSNALIVELHENDEVYMTLPAGTGLYDDSDKYTTFTGFLLFIM